MKSFLKKNETLAYSAIGLLVLFLVLVAFNYLASLSAVRADLTEGRIYTLSEGTKKILRGLQAPVKVKLYISRGEQAMPVQLRSFAQRVEDMVREFKAVAGTNLVIEPYNPKPDSEDEDAAQLDGVEPQQLFSGEQFYLGLAVTQLDRKQVIPALSPQRERLLEYDLAKAIARTATTAKPVLGLMSGMPVLGEKFNPMTRQSSEPWALANELKRDFTLKQVPIYGDTIDPEIKTLLLIHPKDLPDFTEYALDQFILRGGKLIAFVDPYAYFDQQPSPMPGIGGGGSSSTLARLFKAWGVEMNPGKVLADVVYASGAGQRYTPTVLTLNRTALNRDDVVTSQLETLLYAFGGAFDVKPAAGLTVSNLITGSPNSMLVDTVVATLSGEAAMKGFKPDDKARPLAMRLSGKFKTAFPEGPPAGPPSKDPKPDPAKVEAAAKAQLKEGAAENSLILVADVDMLNDGAAVDIQEVFGRRIVVPSNGNLAFAQAMVEQFASGDALTSLRSRAAAFRPLTVVRQMEADAQKEYFGRLKSLEDEAQKTVEKLQELQKARGAAAKGALILTAEQQQELENLNKKKIEVQRELKELRKNLRQDAEALVFWTKVLNIAVMPLLVVLAGLAVFFLRRRRQAPHERTLLGRPVMSPRILGVLVLLLAVLGGGALLVQKQQTSQKSSDAGTLGLPLLKGLQAAQVAQISVRSPKDAITLVKKDERWGIAERDGFPADFDKVRDFVLKAIALKVVQAEPINDADRARLNLDNSGTVVQFADADRKPLGTLTLGRKYFKVEPENPDRAIGDGRYVVLAGDDKRVILISDPLAQASIKTSDWVSKAGFEVDKVKTLEVRDAEGAAWKIERSGDNADWKLLGLAASEKLEITKANAAGYTFARLEIADVAPKGMKPEETGLAKPATVTATTFDGLSYVLKLGKLESENYYATIAISGDPKPEGKDAEERLKKINERLPREKALGEHIVLIPKQKLDDILRKRADLLAKKEEKKK